MLVLTVHKRQHYTTEKNDDAVGALWFAKAASLATRLFVTAQRTFNFLLKLGNGRWDGDLSVMRLPYSDSPHLTFLRCILLLSVQVAVRLVTLLKMEMIQRFGKLTAISHTIATFIQLVDTLQILLVGCPAPTE
jgi:hypothetical protein